MTRARIKRIHPIHSNRAVRQMSRKIISGQAVRHHHFISATGDPSLSLEKVAAPQGYVGLALATGPRSTPSERGATESNPPGPNARATPAPTELPGSSNIADPDFWSKNLVDVFGAGDQGAFVLDQVNKFPTEGRLQSLISQLHPTEMRQMLTGVLTDVRSYCRQQDLYGVAQALNNQVAIAEETVATNWVRHTATHGSIQQDFSTRPTSPPIAESDDAATIIQKLVLAGFGQAADRIRQLHEDVDEDEGDAPPNVGSLRWLADFVASDQMKGSPRTWVDPRGFWGLEWRIPDSSYFNTSPMSEEKFWGKGDGILAVIFLPSGSVRFSGISGPVGQGIERLNISGTYPRSAMMDAVQPFLSRV